MTARRMTRAFATAIALVSVSMACAATAREPAPRTSPVGTYWPQYACARISDSAHAASWRWCVESVTVREGGDLVFRCLWETDHAEFAKIEKGPDEGNRNMYVVDHAGRRLDHVATTEAAKLGGTLTEGATTLRGDFVFRPGATAEPPFTFHDDDTKVVIRDIRLDPARRSGTGKAGDPDLRARLGRIRNAGEVEIIDAWSGWGSSRSRTYVLYRVTGSSTPAGGVPMATMDAFLSRIADAPLLDAPYAPGYRKTDNSPRFSITIGWGATAVVVFSESQGADRVPWALRIDGEQYVIPSDAPARALDLVHASVPPDPAAPAAQ